MGVVNSVLKTLDIQLAKASLSVFFSVVIFLSFSYSLLLLFLFCFGFLSVCPSAVCLSLIFVLFCFVLFGISTTTRPCNFYKLASACRVWAF